MSKQQKSVASLLTPLDDLFTTQEERDDRQLERVRNIPLEELHPFKDHPFKNLEGEEMDRLTESIRQFGSITPALARPLEEGSYELVSGHRRLEACRRLGQETMPVIVREMTDDEAVIAMVDANLQREHILPSEKAFAYKMKMEAMKHQGVTSSQVGTKLRTADRIAQEDGDSRNQIHRYIRLTYLLPELLDMVDQGRIAFTPAVSLSYLKPEEQSWVLEEVEANACTPSVGQAYHLKEESQAGRLTRELAAEMMAREKPNQREAVRVPWERLRGAVPEDYDAKHREEFIVKACEYYAKYLRRQRDRDAR